jgi:hypothetical protein
MALVLLLAMTACGEPYVGPVCHTVWETDSTGTEYCLGES